MALLEQMGWQDAELVRMPSGDGAILAFVGEGADAASMVEPYAAMLEHLGIGRVVKRTGDVWPGAPGCSLTTTARQIEQAPELVERVVRAYLRGAELVERDRERAAQIGATFIGVSAKVVERALESNRPNPNAIRNDAAMGRVLELMKQRGYIDAMPEGYRNLTALDCCTEHAAPDH